MAIIEMSVTPYPKNKRVKDKRMVNGVRAMAGGRCEYCKERAQVQVHHIKSKAAGGGDVKGNLIALCACCHGKAHSGEIERAELYAIAARRR